ncbi:MAG: BtrH N-terminal domain-containing protein, partial [Myxococcota bacterium]
MTKNRDFKRLVRARMEKTGERYAAARAQLLRKRGAAPSLDGLFAGYGPCGGIQSETAPLANALRHLGVAGPGGAPLSEAMLHGLTGGLGFLYGAFEWKGYGPTLTLVARSRSMPGTYLAEALPRAGVRYAVHETGSAKKARAQLDAALEAGHPSLSIVDGAALPYYGVPERFHGMSPHVVGVVGAVSDTTGDDVWLDDRGVRPLCVPHEALAAARGSIPKAKHRLVELEEPLAGHDWKAVVRGALDASVRLYDEPPAKPFASNVGTRGLEKWARLLADAKDPKGWPKMFGAGARAYVGLRRAYDGLQHEYTAPDAGRPLYADFLDEAAALLDRPALADAAKEARAIGAMWGRLTRTLAEADDAA